MHTQHTSQTTRRRGRRGPLVAFVVVIAAVAGACSPSPGGGFDIAIGGTLPLPPIVSEPALQGGTVLGCTIGFYTPGLNISGATATIPSVNINPGAGTITIPNIQVHLPAIQVQLPAVALCLGTLALPPITLPADVVATGVLNLGTGQLTITATVTIQLDLFGFIVPIAIPLSPIVVQL